MKSNKTKKNIKKLFQHLRQEGDSSTSFTSDVTVIQSNSVKKVEESSFIIVGDDNNLTTNEAPCPIHSSTPVSTCKHSIKTVNSLQINNNNLNNAQNFQQEVEDLTKEINSDSFLTIDLTTETLNSTNPNEVTVIDLADTTDDCNISNASLSMSGDSDVTVINTKKRKDVLHKDVQMKKFINGIAKLDSSARGQLLEVIAQSISSLKVSQSCIYLKLVQ